MTNPYAPPTADVDDVSPLRTGQVLAGRGTRLGAAILEGVIIVAIVVPLILIGLVLQPSSLRAGGEPPWIGILLCVVAGFGWLALNLKFLYDNGQTIAKKILGIKIVRKDGSRASVKRIVGIRWVVNGLLGAIPLVGPIYGIVDSLFIFNAERRCLHDHLADTIVIVA